MRSAITSKKAKQDVIQMLTLLLLILYVVGTNQWEVIHSFAHDHDTLVSHYDEQEKDPCHRLIYHNDEGQGCHHESHLAISDKCEMCDLAYHGDQSILSNVSFSTGEFFSKQFNFYKSNLDSYWAVISSSRAPPVLA